MSALPPLPIGGQSDVEFIRVGNDSLDKHLLIVSLSIRPWNQRDSEMKGDLEKYEKVKVGIHQRRLIPSVHYRNRATILKHCSSDCDRVDSYRSRCRRCSLRARPRRPGWGSWRKWAAWTPAGWRSFLWSESPSTSARGYYLHKLKDDDEDELRNNDSRNKLQTSA